ncbi:GNAT family N-acetyltransferase [Roseinatronobacter sp.]|uniref:GNAT family N-acetyltransferase n=1 Tax=Roseinatronobacter sp. TaxID=1945755 RepID=UPI0025EC0760|nr:GNAT family N-acetyltransferase [Roseibaca sp.]
MADIATSTFYVPGFMDLSKYRLDRTEPGAAWDRVVEAAPEGTIFSLSAFVEEMDATPALWLCHKGNQFAGAVALAEDPTDPRRTVLAPHIIHGGIMTASPAARQNPVQALAEQFRTTAACFAGLAERYTELRFATAPALADLRPVLWHNYGGDGPKPVLDLRYTSYLPLTPEATEMEQTALYQGCNKSRRQALRYARDSGITVLASTDIDVFLDLYARTFARQGLEMAAGEADFLRRVCTRLAGEGRLRIFAALTPEGDLGSIVVFGLDAKRAYYLYGANEPELRNDHCGSMALFHALQALAQEGVAEADLEGVNSPKRGYFKLSFGGDLRAYYRVSLVQS